MEIIEIKFNGEIKSITKCSLKEFIRSLDIDLDAKGIACAINYRVAPKKKWADIILEDKDEVDILVAVQGG